MNKRKLQDFAAWAKQNLEKQITVSLLSIGIRSESDIKKSRVQGDVTVIEGIEKTFKSNFHEQREQIINRIKTDGFAHTVESFAYTWFNRLIALRFMEIHDYLDHGFKLFPTQANSLPDILANLEFAKDDLNLDMTYCRTLQDNKQNEELYRYVIFQQCKALAKALPMLFSKEYDYLEYFIPTPLLFGETIINKIIDIDEHDFKEDVEIIGWLYQFYVSFQREAIRNKKHTDQDDIPTLTQVFTPDWIVKYMAENSIGRVWLESYPNSPLKNDMKYYVEEPKQDAEVEEKLKTIRYQNVNPEEIKIIEPASGSGHILVYCFDLLLKMYLEKGYSKKDIPQFILRNNLVGLDIDLRASQLASFALAMRARSIDTRFFEEGRYVRPRVYEIIDSKAILHCDYNGKSYKDILREYNATQWLGENQLTNDELNTISNIVDLFDNAKVIGSLLKINPGKYLTIRRKLGENYKDRTQTDIFTSVFFDREFKDILEILRLAHFMSFKYDVMITNPPYLGISDLDTAPKEYLKKNYPNSKSDMFAMFMEVPFLKTNGLRGMVNPDSWMFLKSFEELRLNLCRNAYFVNMAHHGMGEFDAVVQTTSFVVRNTPLSQYNGTYYRLVDSRNKEQDFLSKVPGIEFTANGVKFLKIPGYVIGYFVTDKLIGIFDRGVPLETVSEPRQGIIPGNTEEFVRYWYEVSYGKIGFHHKGYSDIQRNQKKWFPYNKGGAFRRWYGNIEHVINMENNGYDIQFSGKNNNFRLREPKYYFKEGVTWSKINSGYFSTRYMPKGLLFDIAGCTIFEIGENLKYVLGLTNTNVISSLLDFISPTLNYEVEHIKKLPLIIGRKNEIECLVDKAIILSKNDWDELETSFDFRKHNLIPENGQSEKVSGLCSAYDNQKNNNVASLIDIETKINELFVEVYQINEISTSPLIDNIEKTIRKQNPAELIKSLIMYFVGVLFGRYSLVKEGLIYAGGTFDPTRYGNYYVDEDGILPIYSSLGTDDSLTHRIIELIKQAYGAQYYRENIDFIAEALGKKSNETSEETLNRYINDDFYVDHLKIYQKRPIYWMFSSGKSSGFKCLIYMHRYDENTLAKINANYFQPATMYLRNQIAEVTRQGSLANEREKLVWERKRLALEAQLNEAREYGLVLDNMANQYISIDLDDGVKVNYTKFQGAEVTTNHGKVKKDLLVPIK
jgi:hypothetical protein